MHNENFLNIIQFAIITWSVTTNTRFCNTSLHEHKTKKKNPISKRNSTTKSLRSTLFSTLSIVTPASSEATNFCLFFHKPADKSLEYPPLGSNSNYIPPRSFYHPRPSSQWAREQEWAQQVRREVGSTGKVVSSPIILKTANEHDRRGQRRQACVSPRGKKRRRAKGVARGLYTQPVRSESSSSSSSWSSSWPSRQKNLLASAGWISSRESTIIVWIRHGRRAAPFPRVFALARHAALLHEARRLKRGARGGRESVGFEQNERQRSIPFVESHAQASSGMAYLHPLALPLFRNSLATRFLSVSCHSSPQAWPDDYCRYIHSPPRYFSTSRLSLPLGELSIPHASNIRFKLRYLSLAGEINFARQSVCFLSHPVWIPSLDRSAGRLRCVFPSSAHHHPVSMAAEEGTRREVKNTANDRSREEETRIVFWTERGRWIHATFRCLWVYVGSETCEEMTRNRSAESDDGFNVEEWRVVRICLVFRN